MQTKTNGTSNGHALATTAEPRRNMGLAARSFDEAKAQASALAQAEGFVPRSALGRPAAVLAALMTGAELGIGPMEALRSIHVIEGKPTLSAEFMLTRAIQAGVKHQWLELSTKVARLKLSRPGWEPLTLSYTIEEAEAAGVTRKDNWRKYPAAMLRARCISAAIRAYCPDVLGAGLYTPEEMGAETDEAGEPIVVESAPMDARDAAPYEPSGEASCGAPEPEPAPAVEAPAQLSQCTDAPQLAAWIQANASKPAARRRPDDVRGKVREHATRIAGSLGLAPEDVEAFVAETMQALEAALAG